MSTPSFFALPPPECTLQDVADVGSVVWDAEVLLAHYLDQAYGSRLQGMRLLEVGAGTGLAGIVSEQHSSCGRLCRFSTVFVYMLDTQRTLNVGPQEEFLLTALAR